MKKTSHLYLMVAVLGLGMSVRADILELKNGTVLNGKYAGGTAGTLRFDNGAGQQVIETSQAVALTFTTPAPVAVAPAAPAQLPAPVAAPSSVTLPPGTTLLVRMMDSISSRNGAGTPFTTR